MQPQGHARQPSNRTSVPATDDEIREKYLERAIRELNAFARRLGECEHCPRGQLMPVLGSGHPQADIFMVKYSARPSEVEEGVAFYGRTGNALMKSLKRLSIDPLAVYGTLCVKCPVADPALADPACVSRLTEELAIVAAQDDGRDGGRGPGGDKRTGDPARPAPAGRPGPSFSSSRRPSRPCSSPTSMTPSTRRPPSGSSGGRSACSDNGGLTSRRISRPVRGGRVRGRLRRPGPPSRSQAINRTGCARIW